MSEKSGMQMLEEILNSVALLNKRYEVIEQNMKEILNRMNGFHAQNINQNMDNRPKIESTSPLPGKISIGADKPKSPENTTKVMGKIKKDDRALIGVFVKITNSEGQMVKETKTNRAGEWMCFLPVGKYKAEYKLEGIVDSSVNFQIKSGQTLLRVAQSKQE